MFGINPAEFIVLLAVAAVVLGPERLPEYAQGLARMVRELRRMAQGASRQVREEIGPEFDEIDWQKLDPRQYDPRRIVRDALSDAWDPDDPLGLKENGYSKDDLSLKNENGKGAANGSAARPAANGTKPKSADPADQEKPATGTPAFDPDAT